MVPVVSTGCLDGLVLLSLHKVTAYYTKLFTLFASHIAEILCRLHLRQSYMPRLCPPLTQQRSPTISPLPLLPQLHASHRFQRFRETRYLFSQTWGCSHGPTFTPEQWIRTSPTITLNQYLDPPPPLIDLLTFGFAQKWGPLPLNPIRHFSSFSQFHILITLPNNIHTKPNSWSIPVTPDLLTKALNVFSILRPSVTTRNNITFVRLFLREGEGGGVLEVQIEVEKLRTPMTSARLQIPPINRKQTYDIQDHPPTHLDLSYGGQPSLLI